MRLCASLLLILTTAIKMYSNLSYTSLFNHVHRILYAIASASENV